MYKRCTKRVRFLLHLAASGSIVNTQMIGIMKHVTILDEVYGEGFAVPQQP
jgi:hypothetical protein